MNVARVKSLVRRQLNRIEDGSRRRSLNEVLVPPYQREVIWDYAAGNVRIPCWIVAEDLEAGVQLLYSEGGFGPGDPWGVVRTSDSSAGSDDQWFTSLDDAFVNSGLWHGEMPPEYEVG